MKIALKRLKKEIKTQEAMKVEIEAVLKKIQSSNKK